MKKLVKKKKNRRRNKIRSRKSLLTASGGFGSESSKTSCSVSICLKNSIPIPLTSCALHAWVERFQTRSEMEEEVEDKDKGEEKEEEEKVNEYKEEEKENLN